MINTETSHVSFTLQFVDDSSPVGKIPAFFGKYMLSLEKSKQSLRKLAERYLK